MDDLLSEFLTETSEALAVLDVELVKFEQDPSDSEILGNIFRLVHTIKGTCGFLGLPIQLLVKYFDKKDDLWQIKPEIREMVTYKEYNLLNDLTPLGHFDVVFCRNVLIYFDQETKGKVLESIADLMPQDGTLFLGVAETVLGITKRFQPVAGQRGVYSTVPAKADA